MPVIKMNLRYKPMEVVTKAPHYFKYVPSVYSDALNFDFADRDYEIIERDKVFVRDINAKITAGNGMIQVTGSAQPVKQEPLTETDLERFIDAMEKIYQITKNKQDKVMEPKFYDLADQALT